MTNGIGIRKSTFNGLTTVPAGATFDFVSSGNNYKITYENLITALGGNAPIVTSANDISSVPVLNDQGSKKVIRNLVGKNGVKTLINQFNGIDISINQTFDMTGIPLVDDINADEKAFRSLNSNTLTITSPVNGQISIEGEIINRRVIVNQLSDLPPAIAGFIQLADRTEYYLGDNVDIGTNTIRTGTNNVISSAVGTAVLSHTGANMFEVVDAISFNLNGVSLSSTGRIFQASDTVQGTTTISMTSTFINTCDTFGIFTDIRALVIDIVSVLNATGTTCVSFDGTIPFISLVRFSIFSTSNLLAVDLGTTVSSTLEISNNAYSAPTGIGILGLLNGGNITPGNVGSITSCEFLGGIGATNNILPTDFRWFIKNNSAPLIDTRPIGLADMNLNAVETVITAINTPTLIAGSFISVRNSHFLASTNARITYLGEKPYETMIDLSATFFPVSGSNKVLRIFIAVNGTPVMSREATASSSATVGRSCFWQQVLNTNDIIEAYVENRTDTINVIASSCTLRAF